MAEEIFEGMRCYSQNIKKNGDLVRSLAIGYLRDRVPSALMRNSAATRFTYAMNIIEEYNIQGSYGINLRIAKCMMLNLISFPKE